MTIDLNETTLTHPKNPTYLQQVEWNLTDSWFSDRTWTLCATKPKQETFSYDAWLALVGASASTLSEQRHLPLSTVPLNTLHLLVAQCWCRDLSHEPLPPMFKIIGRLAIRTWRKLHHEIRQQSLTFWKPFFYYATNLIVSIYNLQQTWNT